MINMEKDSIEAPSFSDLSEVSDNEEEESNEIHVYDERGEKVDVSRNCKKKKTDGPRGASG